MTSAVKESGCAITNQTCLCTNPVLQNSMATCINEHCTIKEALSKKIRFILREMFLMVSSHDEHHKYRVQRTCTESNPLGRCFRCCRRCSCVAGISAQNGLEIVLLRQQAGVGRLGDVHHNGMYTSPLSSSFSSPRNMLSSSSYS